ncbi:hypothetical protein [Streptomyces fuscichromogenes]|uniref:Uncharacterized protein n=1 Tax=Streptomyces fuscichromogenes TaxID=1324013 RepID=A0A917XBI3_9ACTN|nr:hypothetical protein [Streptomyces fuscichromogenes]GGN05943.1 hypothetical protein GCM10011578_029880 [Streptomyces fuscichromogenes]
MARLRLRSTPVGDALLIHPRGRFDDRAAAFADGIAEDPLHTLAVVDLPGDAIATEWEAVARLLSSARYGSPRLIFGRGTPDDIRTACQRIADRLEREVLAPGGDLVPTVGGGLFVPGDDGAAWLRFRPGHDPEPVAQRFPKPHWEFSAPARTQQAGPHTVAQPLPAGVWLRHTDPDPLAAHHRRAVEAVATDPHRYLVVLGSPGTPPLSLDDLTRFWDTTVLPGARPAVRFVLYGALDVPGGRAASGQALADALGHPAVLYDGLPDDRTEPAETTCLPRASVPPVPDRAPAPPVRTESVAADAPDTAADTADTTDLSEAPTVRNATSGGAADLDDAPTVLSRTRATRNRSQTDTSPEAGEREREREAASTSGSTPAPTPTPDRLPATTPEPASVPATGPTSALPPAGAPAAPSPSTLIPVTTPASPQLPTAESTSRSAPQPRPVLSSEPAPSAEPVPPITPTPSTKAVHNTEAGPTAEALPTAEVTPTVGTAPTTGAVPTAAAGPSIQTGPPVGAVPPAGPMPTPGVAPTPGVVPPTAAALSTEAGPTAGAVSPIEPAPPTGAAPSAETAPSAAAGPAVTAVTAAPASAPSPSPSPAAAVAPSAPVQRPVPPASPRFRLESAAPEPDIGVIGDIRDIGDVHDVGVPSSVVAPGAEPAAGSSAVARTGAVRVQPVPRAAASALPPERGVAQERDWMRRTFSEQYNALAGSVSRVMSESPGLRGGSRTEAADALTDLVAVRLYLSGDPRRADAAVREAVPGPHVPLARCVTAGLRRLPSYRGPALLRTRLGDAERAWYREGRLATEWAFCHARTSLHPGPRGSGATDVLIWSMTARRTSSLDAAVPDRVVFLPGTVFRVLRADGTAVLMRELSPSEAAEAAEAAKAAKDVHGGQGGDVVAAKLDEIAVKGLEKILDALERTGTDAAAESADPPGLIVIPRTVRTEGAES